MDVEEGTDADFEAGYAGTGAPAAAMQPTNTEPEKKDDKPAVQPEAQATEASEAKTDPTTAPASEPEPEPEWKKAIAKLEERTRNVEGHIGGLTAAQKALRETMAAAQAAAKAAPDAPTQAQLDKAISDPDEWKTLETDFPEWARGTKSLIDARLKGVPQIDPEDLQRKVAEQVRGQTEAVRKEIVTTALEAVMPGWTEEVKTSEFAEWAKAQPDEVKRLIVSDKVGDAARMLRLYDKHKNAPAPAPTPTAPPKDTSRKDRFAAAVAPKGTAATPAPGKSDEDELMAGYTGR